MECRDGYEVKVDNACVPALLFDPQLMCSVDDFAKSPSPFLPTCQIVETCSPESAAHQCTEIVPERNSAECTVKEYTDSWGRKRVDETNCGQSQPYKITITPPGGEPIEFNYNGKEYRAPYKNSKGENIGFIAYSLPKEYIYYHNDKAKTSFLDMKDGTHVVKKNRSDDDYVTTFTHDGAVFFTQKASAKGRTDTATYADGTVRVAQYDSSETMTRQTITQKDGTVTSISRTKDGSLEGTRRDRHGRVLEDVVLVSDYPMHKPGSDDPDAEYLVFRNRKNGEIRAVGMSSDIKYDRAAHFQPLSYDANLGTLSLVNKDGSTILESSQGRTDVRAKNGSVTGSTVAGEMSFSFPDGDAGGKKAIVIHPDLCGAQLNQDDTVDRWCREIEDKAINEKLEPTEKAFLKAHADIVDKRDFLEIHRRFRGDETKLRNFYSKLSEIDNVTGLSQSEKNALCKTMMHHVAYPDEIVQGRSPTCNVAVLQIEMAKQRPTEYVDFVVDALSADGKPYKSIGGKTVRFDEANLKMTDLSGRDLASRVFQTAALQLNFYPSTFKNTVDGTGKSGRSQKEFDGLNTKDIAELRYQLTGEETAECWISSSDDLERALRVNGGKPIVIRVNGDQPPFTKGEEKSDRKGTGSHVVILNSIESGSPKTARISNPWGPSDDAAGTGLTMSVDELFKNMQFDTESDFGILLLPGKRGTTGTIVNGKYEPL